VVGLFRAGNLAVTIFFVVGGYLLTRSLLGEVDHTGRLRARTATVRRWARVSAHVYALVAVVLIVHTLDDTDLYDRSNLRQSAVRIVTYTWNWFLRDSPLLARPDLGHLWFVCVYLQVTVLLIVVVKLLGRRRVALLVLLAATLVAVTLWRSWVVDEEGLYSALLRTTTRMDGMVWGALAAVAMPWIRHRVRRAAAVLMPVALLGLVALMLTTGHDETYFRWQGVLINVAAATFVVSAVTLAAPTRLSNALSWRPFVVLGNASMAIFVWHYPIFWAVTRHTTSWSWPARTVVALAITAAFVLAAQRLVERPLQTWLAHPRWDRRRSTAAEHPEHPEPAEPPTPADAPRT
jgi:peptidoglycan/LPS O-acetylase OafA/YrhL